MRMCTCLEGGDEGMEKWLWLEQGIVSGLAYGQTQNRNTISRLGYSLRCRKQMFILQCFDSVYISPKNFGSLELTFQDRLEINGPLLKNSDPLTRSRYGTPMKYLNSSKAQLYCL